MPQPLSRVLPEAAMSYESIGDYPLLRHSELAALAMQAISSWSTAEAFMAGLYATLGGGETAAATFLALKSTSAKLEAINAIGEIDLGEDYKVVLDAIISLSKVREEQRNKLAHWCWGDSPDIPDALLLVNPCARHTKIIEEIFVYKREDFEEIIRDNVKLGEVIGMFNRILWREDEQLFDLLCAELEIQARIDCMVEE